jgi:hypothetical protein
MIARSERDSAGMHPRSQLNSLRNDSIGVASSGVICTRRFPKPITPCTANRGCSSEGGTLGLLKDFNAGESGFEELNGFRSGEAGVVEMETGEGLVRKQGRAGKVGSGCGWL